MSFSIHRPTYGREYSVDGSQVAVATRSDTTRAHATAAALLACIALATLLFPANTQAAELMGITRGAATHADFAGHSPESCTCHGDLVKQWKASMHAKAWTDPVYQYARGEAVDALGAAAIDDFCIGCHAPAGLMADATANAESDPVMNGINCGLCHQVTGSTSPGNPGNLSLGFPLGGPDGTRRAHIMDPKAPHLAAGNEFFNSAEYCGSCHNVNHPVNGLHLETTYTEWAETPYAKQGITCQNCHMHKELGGSAPFTGQAAAGAPTRDNIFAMSFIGANVAQGNAELNSAQLKKAATVELQVDDIVAPGQTAEVVMTATNTGAGHSIPTGVGEIREVWLELYAENPDGTKTELARTDFNLVIKDAEGNEGGWDFWNAVEIVADNRLHVGQPFSQQVAFEMPANAESAELVAVLRYKSAPDEVAEDAGIENPTTDMATASATVYANEEAKAVGDTETPSDSEGDNLGVIIGVIVGAVILVGGIVLVTIRQRRKSSEQ